MPAEERVKQGCASFQKRYFREFFTPLCADAEGRFSCSILVFHIVGGETNCPVRKFWSRSRLRFAALTEALKNSVTGVIVNYEGINVEDDTKLRKSLREAGCKYQVVKNTLLSRALKEAGIEGLDSVLEGTTAIAMSESDYAAGAKILCEYAETAAKANKKFAVKAGFIDGAAVDAAGC